MTYLEAEKQREGKGTFGRDEIVLRLYPLWQDQTENVWRVEWRIRKETLKRFGLRIYENLLESMRNGPQDAESLKSLLRKLGSASGAAA